MSEFIDVEGITPDDDVSQTNPRHDQVPDNVSTFYSMTPAPTGQTSYKSKQTTSTKQRLKVNARERQRMHDLNSAVDSLREVIPQSHGSTVKKISKIGTLLLARNYILQLDHTLNEMKVFVSNYYGKQAVQKGLHELKSLGLGRMNSMASLGIQSDVGGSEGRDLDMSMMSHPEWISKTLGNHHTVQQTATEHREHTAGNAPRVILGQNGQIYGMHKDPVAQDICRKWNTLFSLSLETWRLYDSWHRLYLYLISN